MELCNGHSPAQQLQDEHKATHEAPEPEDWATDISEDEEQSDEEEEGATCQLKEQEPQLRVLEGDTLTQPQLLLRRLERIRALQQLYEGCLLQHVERMEGLGRQTPREKKGGEVQAVLKDRGVTGAAESGKGHVGEPRLPHVATKRPGSAHRAFRAKLPRTAVLEEAASAGVSRELERHGALLCLWGARTRFLVRRTAATLGRRGGVGAGAGAEAGAGAAAQQPVDIDLDLESGGLARRVSRQQGRLALHPSGAFTLTNTGRRPLAVNNARVGRGQMVELSHLSLLEVGGLRFLVMLNPAAIKRACAATAPSPWGR